jgi:hypothetical protein
VDRRPAIPPCPGSAASCKSGENRGKSVTQRNLKSLGRGLFMFASERCGCSNIRARPNVVEPPCHQCQVEYDYRECVWPYANKYGVVMVKVQKFIEISILFFCYFIFE